MPHVPSSGIRVEDVTYTKARKQSEILKEAGIMVEEEKVPVAPVSTTPEQITEFLMELYRTTNDPNVKKVYAQSVLWINELQESKKTIKKLKAEVLSLKLEVIRLNDTDEVETEELEEDGM